MKKILLAIIALALTTAAGAQESFKVSFKGARPTISDFVQAYVTNCVDDKAEVEIDEAGIAFKSLWTDYRKGTPLPEGATMTVDERGGFVSCDNGQGEFLTRWEMCYWNEADGRHKLFAYGTSTFQNGRFIAGQYDGLEFYRYDNATKTMRLCDDEDLRRRYMTSDGAWISYALPRTGKDIVTTSWYDDGRQKQSVLKWNGHGFVPADAVGIIDGAESTAAYVKRYLKQMRAEAENIEFDMYAIVDIDGDGKPELWVRGDEDQNTQGIYAIVGDSVSILAGIDGLSDFMFYRHAVGYSRYHGGQYRYGFTFLDNSKPGDSYDSEEQSNPYTDEHELQGAVYYKNGDEISEDEFKKAEELLGEKCPEPAEPVWHPIAQ